MTDTEQTPVQRAASIIQLWESNPFGGEPTDVARDVFASVGIIGLTKVLSAHPTWRLRGCCPDDDWYICVGCGAEIETALAHVDAEFRDHQAVAVTAWLTGGGA